MHNDDDQPGLLAVADPPPPAQPLPRVSDDDPGPPSPPVPSYADIAAAAQHAHRNPLLPAPVQDPVDGPRDGDTYDDTQDRGRLNGQHLRVARALADNGWHTLAGLSAATGDPQASVSARLRDLRKPRFGGRVIDRRRVPNGNGQHEYRMDPDARMPDTVPDPTLQHCVQLVAEYPDNRDEWATPPALVVLLCRQCGWRYELPEGSTVHDAHDALARHPRQEATQ